MAGWSVRLGRLVTPPRQRGVEILDSPGVDVAVLRRSHRDIALSNALLGGTRAIGAALREAMAQAPDGTLSLVDVGTGSGAILDVAVREGARAGIRLRCIALDLDERLVRGCARRASGVCASALALPFADRSIDIVMCSLLLHHFTGDDLLRAVAELDRVARHRVIIHDLRRSWIAAAGLWTVSFPLAFHPVSRHDGVVSVLRGFTGAELSALIGRAIGAEPRVARRLGFRLIASWSPIS
jgi:SAM-dependent methyltransferase